MAGVPEGATLAGTVADVEPALGCSKCRFSKRGCARCRAPSFQSRAQNPAQEQKRAANPSLRKRARKQVVPPSAVSEPVQPPTRERGHSASRKGAKQATAAGLLQRRPEGTKRRGRGGGEDQVDEIRATEAPQKLQKVAKQGRRGAEQPTRTARRRSLEQDIGAAAIEAGTGERLADGQAAVLDAVQGPDGTSVLVLERAPPEQAPTSAADAKGADAQAGAGRRTPTVSGRSMPSGNIGGLALSEQDGMDSDSRRVAFREALQSASVKDGAERKQRFREALQNKITRSREKPGASPATSARATSSSGRKSASAQNLAAQQVSPEDDGPLGNYRVALWEPPVSPFGLIEEQVYHDPWRLLVACMLLNKTSGRAVRKVLWDLFEYAPTAEAAVNADVSKVEGMIYPLGLFRKRAVMFKRFSQEYLEKEWTDPKELHGIGQYAADAYYIFCRGEWRNRAAPADKDLLKYFLWLQQTDGLGTGLTPDVWPHASPAVSKQTDKAGGDAGAITGAGDQEEVAALAEGVTAQATPAGGEDESVVPGLDASSRQDV